CHPEDFIEPNPKLVDALREAADVMPIAIATNSPSDLGKRILGLLGVDDELMAQMTIVGPDTIGVSKPDPMFFERVAVALGVDPEACIAMGDDYVNDAFPPVELGMGAAVVNGPDQAIELLRLATDEAQFEPIDLSDLAQDDYRPGEVSIVAFTGRAGAGKTTTAQEYKRRCDQMGIPAAILSLDSFFKLSSKGRKAWLAEGEALGPEEYSRRADQMSWWDFEAAVDALETLRRGEPVHLTNVYNRADGGELTGEVTIVPPPEGMVIIFEGVASAHLSGHVDRVVAINAHPKVRKDRLLERDKHRGEKEARKRFEVTQGFENRYFQKHAAAAHLVLDNTNGSLFRVPQLSFT
ncbi:protein containing Haloacid dehalogenase-like hydrolase domain, partial [sediment metagenome]